MAKKKATAEAVALPKVDPAPAEVWSFKAFEAGFICRGYSYADKDDHEFDGEVSVCSGGFHACEIPLNTWSYYPPKVDSCYAEVAQSGAVLTENDKTASSRLRISARLSLPGFIKAQVEVIWEKLRGAATTGAEAHAATTGNWAHAATTGNWAHAACLGLGGKAKCGPKGSITLAWWDAKAERPRLAVGYEGEGIEAGVEYRVNDSGEFEVVEKEHE